MSTFDRIFGSDESKGPAVPLPARTAAVLPNGPWEEDVVRSNRTYRKSWPQPKRLEMGLAEENGTGTEQVLGSRKKRIQDPGKESGVGAALSPRLQAWSGSPRSFFAPKDEQDERGDKDLFTPSGRPLRRRSPSVDRGSAPLPPWLSLGDCSPPSGRSMSPRGKSPRGRSPRSPRSPSPERSPSPPRVQDRRVLEWTRGYELDSYRCIKVFPENAQYKTCAALQPGRAVEKEEHAGLVGADGFFKAASKRRISPNSRGSAGSIVFTPPSPTDACTPSTMSPQSVRENLQGLQSTRATNGTLSLLSPIPRKRLHSPDSPGSQGDNPASPPAGMASPRFSWAADMVPDIKNKEAGQGGGGGGFSPRSTARDAVSPRSLIRHTASLGTGLYAEEPKSMLETFLGARKGRAPSPVGGGASPRTTSPPQEGGDVALGFGSLSWGKVAAGGYGLDVAARQAAGRRYGSGNLNQALDWSTAEVTFKEPLIRHREKVLVSRARSPQRWK